MMPHTSQLFKAVCYRCSYVGADSQSSHCPICHFPVILESETTPAGGAEIETILRSSAPLLPGVDSQPRKAQLLAEARCHRIAVIQPPLQPRLRIQPVVIVAAGLQRLKVAVICASAVAAGAVAAVINHGLL